MTNAWCRETLKEIRKVQKVVDALRQDPSLTVEQKNRIQMINNLLLDIDDRFVVVGLGGIETDGT